MEALSYSQSQCRCLKIKIAVQLFIVTMILFRGAQWLVGRVLDSESKSCEFETHLGYCVVSLSKAVYPLLSTGSTEEDRKSS